jgi:hypothetical protein
MTTIQRPAKRRRGPGAVLALLALVAALVLALAIPFTSAAKPAPAEGAAASAPRAAATASKSVKPLYWGALIGPQFTGEPPPWDMQAAAAFTKTVGKGMSLLPFSQPWADCSHKGQACEFLGFPTIAMQTVRSYGAIPFFNWASQSIPTEANQPNFRLKQVIKGKYDPFIENFAEDAAEWGHPFFLRFNWEMNGFWYPWSPGVNKNKPGEYVAAWRHVWKIFQREGASNATWTWCPNVDFTGKLTNLNTLYPGDKYVDWTCLDGFNWGETHNSVGWQTFDEIFSGTYKRVTKLAPNKPMVIGETASEERGGSKAGWIRNMLKVIPQKYKKVRAVLWFDEKDQGMDWPLSSSKSANNAFKQGIAKKYFMPNSYSGQPAGKVKPPGRVPPPPDLTPPVT